jgi:glyoxalase family protein
MQSWSNLLSVAVDAGLRVEQPVAMVKPEVPGSAGTGTAFRVQDMNLEGIHHVTCITGDAPRNVDFYSRVLGLRLVKKTVNQDDPTVYHLFYADELGSAGADITFFEYPGAREGRAGAGMVHRISWRVPSEEALDFWADRLGREGIDVERGPEWLRFADPEGLGLELAVVEAPDEPLVAVHPEIPEELALQGFDGVRAYSVEPGTSRRFLQEGLGFEPSGDGWEVRGSLRGSRYAYDPPPPERGIGGAGTVHHVAWSSPIDEHEAWRERAARAGASPTPVIERFYFRSIYFREPSGVLFEIATLGPGFTADEPLETLGESLSLPPAYEHLRERLADVLTPLPPTRSRVAR